MELQQEIELSQQRLIDLGKAVDEEGKRVGEAEEAIKLQHTELVEKLRATHKSDVESLQAQLDEAISARSTSEQAILDKEAEIDGLKSQVEKEMAAARSSMGDLTIEHESELAKLKTELEAKLAAENEERTVAHQAAIESLESTLTEAHESELSTLKAAHEANIAQGTTEAASNYEKQVETLGLKHGAAISELQSQLDNAIAAQAASQADVTKLTAEIADLQAKVLDGEKVLSAAKTDLQKEIEKHQKELRTVSEDYQKEIDALQGNSDIRGE